jgi:hypothetical protein
MIAPLAISRERHSAGAYSFRSTMPNTLENLQPGTPVYVGETHVADVRAVYAAHGTRQAELLVIYWLSRKEEVALPVGDVKTIVDGRVILMNSDVNSYSTLIAFEAARYPTVQPLS